MTEYDHEDAFRDANLYAGQKVQLSEALRVAADKNTARVIINDCQLKYAALFDAFIAGVDYGRKNPK